MADSIVDIAKRIEEKLDKLLALEQGLISYSNDPSEIVTAKARGRRLHTFISHGISETGEDDIRCSGCKISITECGATMDSWYCD